eukprot:scaffold3450_cov114-Cylindrotheca_fusiformis.AAC.21
MRLTIDRLLKSLRYVFLKVGHRNRRLWWRRNCPNYNELFIAGVLYPSSPRQKSTPLIIFRRSN